MYRQFRLLLRIYRGVSRQDCKCYLGDETQFQFLNLCHISSTSFPSNLIKLRAFHLEEDSATKSQQNDLCENTDSKDQLMHINKTVLSVQNLLKEFSETSNEALFQELDILGLSLSDDLVLDVLKRLHSDWKLAFRFFSWVSNNILGFSPGPKAFNEMLGILGKAKRFEELDKLFNEMSLRGIVNERSYGIVVHRYAASHKVEDAINFFYKRRNYALKLDLIAFQTLLLALCRYKHVEAAEYLFLSKRSEFQYDTKTWNIILNGWSVLGNLRETKRFWNEIIRYKCRPDKVTYGIFINALCKSGKISTAVKLFQAMWEKGCTPDVVICNSVIDGLCFKKRIPEAIRIFREMNEKDCKPDVVTYNCLIKYLCKIQRIKVAYQLLDEMEMKGQDCSPNSTTYIHLLTTTKRPEEVRGLLERMKSNGCKMTGDLYNLVLKLYMNWACEELVQSTWAEMLGDGLGPDQRSYTIMVHGLYEQGRLDDAFVYFEEMVSKGMVPEPRTNILVDAMKIKIDEKRSRRNEQC